MGKIRNYGCWAGQIIKFKAETEKEDSKSPHIMITFQDNNSDNNTAAVNVKSTDRTDTDLIYWFDHDFQHPITRILENLDLGFHPASSSGSDLSLDFYRTQPKLLEIDAGVELPHDIEGPDNDVLDKLVPLLQDAIDQDNVTVYIFGSNWNDPTRPGIHDVHMNQGSLPRFDNGVGVDGAMIFHYPGGRGGAGAQERWAAVFLAFASQKFPTNDRTGQPVEGSETLSAVISNRGGGENEVNSRANL